MAKIAEVIISKYPLNLLILMWGAPLLYPLSPVVVDRKLSPKKTSSIPPLSLSSCASPITILSLMHLFRRRHLKIVNPHPLLTFPEIIHYCRPFLIHPVTNMSCLSYDDASVLVKIAVCSPIPFRLSSCAPLSPPSYIRHPMHNLPPFSAAPCLS